MYFIRLTRQPGDFVLGYASIAIARLTESGPSKRHVDKTKISRFRTAAVTGRSLSSKSVSLATAVASARNVTCPLVVGLLRPRYGQWRQHAYKLRFQVIRVKLIRSYNFVRNLLFSEKNRILPFQ